MSEMGSAWHDLYKAAIFESDPEKVSIRIKEASQAIRSRLADLRQHRPMETKELMQLDRSMYFLGMLHSVSRVKQSPSTSI